MKREQFAKKTIILHLYVPNSTSKYARPKLIKPQGETGEFTIFLETLTLALLRMKN
jgi:hypothetical protein